MDKRAAVNSRKSVVALRSMSVGVRKVSMAIAVTNKGDKSEIQKRLEVLRNENFEKGEEEEEEEDFDVLHLNHRNNGSTVDVMPIMAEEEDPVENASPAEHRKFFSYAAKPETFEQRAAS